MTKTITFVTGNANKLKEVLAILSDGSANTTIGEYNITNQKIDLDELQGTIEQVTIHKTQQAASIINGPVMVEDTCLCYKALNDLPGPYIKWFVDSIGLDGLVKLLAGYEDKSAHTVCTFGYCEGPGQPVLLFQGTTYGVIVDSRGPTHFGYDSVFQPIGYDQTFAEMDKDVKNSISHRYRALYKLKNYLLTGDHSSVSEELS